MIISLLLAILCLITPNIISYGSILQDKAEIRDISLRVSINRQATTSSSQYVQDVVELFHQDIHQWRSIVDSYISLHNLGEDESDVLYRHVE
jgi:hypothetical protein